jgi:lysophospholipase L1-like esterase
VQPGARYLIVLLGINDIGFPGTATADEIIAGHRQIIHRAHALGLKVYGGTLTPFQAFLPGIYYTPDGEAKRQAVNLWIRTSKSYDAVIDFDKALRDPSNPAAMRSAYDSGDNLHPNDAGYQAMADAIDLSLFMGKDLGRRAVTAAKTQPAQPGKPQTTLCPCPP